MRDPADLESVHRYSTHHRELLARSDWAGCFYCRTIFAPAEIRRWIPERDPATGAPLADRTALCPRCGVDAVLPSAAPIRLDLGLLADMHRHWF